MRSDSCECRHMQQPHLMHTHLNLKMCVSACEVSESKLRDTDKLAVLLFFFFLINSINIITSALFTPFFVEKKETDTRAHECMLRTFMLFLVGNANGVVVVGWRTPHHQSTRHVPLPWPIRTRAFWRSMISKSNNSRM